MAGILDCALTRWQPDIGDPSVMGWVTVAVYALAALLAALAARSGGRERTFWALAALLLAFLAVNKELDLQSFMTAIGRCLARAQGWYDERRVVERDFILALIAGSALALVLLLWLLRGTWARTALSLIGLCFVSAFVLVRAIGFHHMDALIGSRILSLKANWVLELTGPVLVILGALGQLAAARQRH